ncbi:hypothetical protein T439DRAFT_321665 [Meredithblackwellia eburnea MCA 4105]
MTMLLNSDNPLRCERMEEMGSVWLSEPHLDGGPRACSRTDPALVGEGEREREMSLTWCEVWMAL